MTFNLRGSFIDDGENRWPCRAALCVRTIREEDPDLVGFQEVQEGNLESFEASLPDYEKLVGPRYNNRDPFAYPSVFWKPGKFEKIESGVFWLSRSPDRFSGDWETNCIRSALWIRFRHKETGHEFVHLNTHLDHISAEARFEGSRVILEKLRPWIDAGAGILITGDFNCVPGTPPYQLYREAGFRDAHLEAGNRDGEGVFTFHAFTGRAKPGEERIDWILFRGFEGRLATRSCRVITAAEPPLYPSDHYPVVADFEVI